jgi:imidazolonepropionase-like amidohydrolase
MQKAKGKTVDCIWRFAFCVLHFELQGAPMRRANIGASLVVAIAALAVAGAQRAPATVFERARILIGDGRVIDNGILVVENGRIARVGRMGEVQPPAGATRVDLSGKTMMPALIDAHMHIGYENMNGWAGRNYTRENVIETLERLAYYGVGAIFSAGTDPVDLAQQIQRDQASGKVGGAKFVFAAGAGPPGAGPNGALLKELATFGKPIVHGITGDADARQMVKEVAAQHIPIIKVWVTDRNGTQPKTAPAAYRALIDEAHKHNMRVVAHATDGLADAKDLARAGLDGYIHAVLEADAEFAAMAKRNDAFVTPAQGLGLRGNIPGLAPWFEDPFFQEAAPPATIERYRQQQAKLPPPQPGTQTLQQRYDRAARMVKVLQDGGVRIAVGTDAGATPDYPPGYPVHREMEIYTKIGMTPEQVLIAATKVGAEAHRLDKDMGTLEAGKLANLLVLDADPRMDIRNTHKIARVYLQGREVDRAALQRKWKK